MNYKVFWALTGTALVGGMVWLASTQLNPRAISLIKLSEFESSKVAANSILLRLQEEFKASPVWIIGIDPEVEDHLQVMTLLLQNEPPLFDEVWMDSSLGFSLSNQTDSQPILSNENYWIEKLKANPGKRIAMVTALPYASQVLTGSPAQLIAAGSLGVGFKSLVISAFSRNRDQEAGLKIPCQRGQDNANQLSPLGCWITDRARLNYRKKMKSGASVGMLDQIGGNDFLFLMSREP